MSLLVHTVQMSGLDSPLVLQTTSIALLSLHNSQIVLISGKILFLYCLVRKKYYELVELMSLSEEKRHPMVIVEMRQPPEIGGQEKEPCYAGVQVANTTF